MFKNFSTKALVFSGLMIALSVILRLLGFPQSGTYRIEFGFLPIVILSHSFGALTAGLSYILADIIGTLLTGYSPFPLITICKFLMGVLFGVFFYKKELNLKRIFFCNIVVLLIIDLLLMTFALIPISGDKGFFAILIKRILASSVNFPARIISIYILSKYLNKFKFEVK